MYLVYLGLIRVSCKIEFQHWLFWIKMTFKVSGCGAVDTPVASVTRGPGFESSHQQILLYHLVGLEVPRLSAINTSLVQLIMFGYVQVMQE